MILRYVFGWFGLMIMAIVNGALREVAYKNILGDLVAHQLSTFTGLLLFGVFIWGMTRLWPLHSSRDAWTIGVIWLMMTVCFEFLFGHYVIGHPWGKLLHDYNLLEGRLWILVLIWTTTAPSVFFRTSRRKP